MSIQLAVTYDCLAFHYEPDAAPFMETVSYFQGTDVISYPRAQYEAKSHNGEFLSSHLVSLDVHDRYDSHEIYRAAVAARLVLQKPKRKGRKQKAVQHPRGRLRSLCERKEVAKVQKQVCRRAGQSGSTVSRKQISRVPARRQKAKKTVLSSNPFAVLADMS